MCVQPSIHSSLVIIMCRLSLPMLLLLLSAVLRPSKQIFCHSLSSSKPPLLQRRNLSLTMTHTTLRNRNSDGTLTLTVTPQNESDQSASVIICHGLGDSAEGFVDVAEHLSGALPYVKFILPSAPTQRVSFVELS